MPLRRDDLAAPGGGDKAAQVRLSESSGAEDNLKFMKDNVPQPEKGFTLCGFGIRRFLAVFGAVTLGVLVSHLLADLPRALQHRSSWIEQRVAETEQLFAAANAVHKILSVKDVLDVTRHLAVASSVRGVAVYGAGPEPLGTTGQAPVMTARAFHVDGQRHFLSARGCCLDLFLEKSRTGLRYDLVVRADLSALTERGGDDFWITTGTHAIAAVIAGCILAIAHGLAVKGPARSLEAAMRSCGSESQAGALQDIAERRCDVFGDVAQAGMALVASLRHRARERLDLERTVVAELPFPVLQHGPHDRLVAANDAALQFFDAASVEELAGRAQDIYALAGAAPDACMTIEGLLGDGRYHGTALVRGPSGPRECDLSARVLRKTTGERWRTLVAFQPCTDGDIRHGGAPSDEGVPAGAERYRRESLLRKWLLECCLTLLARHDPAELQAASSPIRLDMLVEEWFLAASSHGLVNPATAHDVTPQIVGEPEAVAMIVGHALAFCVAASGSETPLLAIHSEPVSAGAIAFSIAEDCEGTEPDESREEREWKLPYAALRRLLGAYGGQITSETAARGALPLRFVLRSRPGAAAVSATDAAGRAA